VGYGSAMTDSESVATNPRTMNMEAPDPHAAYRLEVETAEHIATVEALNQHHQRRAYALHLEVRARDAQVAALEAELEQVTDQRDDLLAKLEAEDPETVDTPSGVAPVPDPA
jgi:hypothetical protein